MEIIRGRDFYIERPTAVCIGKFDGLHLGHRELIRMIVDRKSAGLKAVVFTFEPSFEDYFAGSPQPSIYTEGEKVDYLEAMGVDVCIEFPLTGETVDITAESFLKDILIKKMNMAYLAAGEDITFGKDAKGDREFCMKMAEKYGFVCDIIKKICVDGEVVSSTRVRKALAEGRLCEASRLLGRKYI